MARLEVIVYEENVSIAQTIETALQATASKPLLRNAGKDAPVFRCVVGDLLAAWKQHPIRADAAVLVPVSYTGHGANFLSTSRALNALLGKPSDTTDWDAELWAGMQTFLEGRGQRSGTMGRRFLWLGSCFAFPISVPRESTSETTTLLVIFSVLHYENPELDGAEVEACLHAAFKLLRTHPTVSTLYMPSVGVHPRHRVPPGAFASYLLSAHRAVESLPFTAPKWWILEKVSAGLPPPSKVPKDSDGDVVVCLE